MSRDRKYEEIKTLKAISVQSNIKIQQLKRSWASLIPSRLGPFLIYLCQIIKSYINGIVLGRHIQCISNLCFSRLFSQSLDYLSKLMATILKLWESSIICSFLQVLTVYPKISHLDVPPVIFWFSVLILLPSSYFAWKLQQSLIDQVILSHQCLHPTLLWVG